MHHYITVFYKCISCVCVKYDMNGLNMWFYVLKHMRIVADSTFICAYMHEKKIICMVIYDYDFVSPLLFVLLK